jgi:hypothetical protein
MAEPYNARITVQTLDQAGNILNNFTVTLTRAQWLAFRLTVPLSQAWPWIQNVIAEKVRRELDAILSQVNSLNVNTMTDAQKATEIINALNAGKITLAPEPSEAMPP